MQSFGDSVIVFLDSKDNGKYLNQLDHRILLANTNHVLFTASKNINQNKSYSLLNIYVTKRNIFLTSRKAEPRLNWQLHVHVRAIATITTATAYTPFLALPPCYHVSNLPNARGHFSLLPNMVRDRQTNKQKTQFIMQTRGVSPDNVNFCQPGIIRNQTYGQYNYTSFQHYYYTNNLSERWITEGIDIRYSDQVPSPGDHLDVY